MCRGMRRGEVGEKHSSVPLLSVQHSDTLPTATERSVTLPVCKAIALIALL